MSRPARSLRPCPRPGRPEIGPVINLKGGDEKTVLDCFEEGLRHVGLGAVVAEVARLPMTGPRRPLQLAAKGSRSLGVALHVGVARLRRPISDNRQPRRGAGSPPCRRRRCPRRAWGVSGGSSSSSAARRARARISNWRRVWPSPMPRHSATRPARDRKAGRRDWEISRKMDDVLARAACDFENDARRRQNISKHIENEIAIA